MRNEWLAVLIFVVPVLGAITPSSAVTLPGGPTETALAALLDAAASRQAASDVPGMGRWFEPNQGQFPATTLFRWEAGGVRADFFANHVAVDSGNGSVTLSWPTGSLPAPYDLLPTHLNRYVGSNVANWHERIPTYGAILYREVWPGISLEFHARRGQLEYDLLVAPGANIPDARLRLRGGDVEVLATGEVTVSGPAGLFYRQAPPVAFQVRDNVVQDVVVAPRLEDGVLSFAVGAYDVENLLTIDPAIEQIAYPVLHESAWVDDVDAVSDQVVYAGTTTRYDASGNGHYDGFVALASNDLTTLYWVSTFESISDNRYISLSAVESDNLGGFAAVGTARPGDIPLLSPFQSAAAGVDDLYVLRLDSAGVLVFASRHGGDDDDYSEGSGLEADATGRLFIAGGTRSSNLPTTAGAFRSTRWGLNDALVLVVSPSNTRAYSTYLGGSGEEGVASVALGSDGYFVAYSTTSSGMGGSAGAPQPSHSLGGSYDFRIEKYAYSHGLLAKTYLGGTSDDHVTDIEVSSGSTSRVYVAGHAFGHGLPLVNSFMGYGPPVGSYVAALPTGLNGVSFGTFWRGFTDDLEVSGDKAWISVQAHNAYHGDMNLPLVHEIATPDETLDLEGIWHLSVAPTPCVHYSTYLPGVYGFREGLAVLGNGAVFLAGATGPASPSSPGSFAPNPEGDWLPALSLISDNPASDCIGPPCIFPSTAPMLSGFSASNTVPGVTLEWDASSHECVEEYVIERAEGAGAWTALATTQDTSYLDTAVVACVTYSYRVRADLATAWAGPASVTRPTTAPSAPILSVTYVAPTADLVWSASAPCAASSFDVERDGSVLVSGLPASPLAYSDTPLPGCTVFDWRVQAVNSAGTAWSNMVSVTTDGEPPWAPTLDVQPSGLLDLGAIESWTPSAGCPADEYRLYRKSSLGDYIGFVNSLGGVGGIGVQYSAGDYGAPYATILAPGVSHETPLLLPCVQYIYAVSGVNVYGEGDLSASVEYTNNPGGLCPPPTCSVAAPLCVPVCPSTGPACMPVCVTAPAVCAPLCTTLPDLCATAPCAGVTTECNPCPEPECPEVGIMVADCDFENPCGCEGAYVTCLDPCLGIECEGPCNLPDALNPCQGYNYCQDRLAHPGFQEALRQASFLTHESEETIAVFLCGAMV